MSWWKEAKLCVTDPLWLFVWGATIVMVVAFACAVVVLIDSTVKAVMS